MSDCDIVAFDFDGTLTVRDSFTDFLVWRAGPLGCLARAPAVAVAVLAWLFHRSRGRLKAAVTGAFLGGATPAAVTADAERYHASRAAGLLRPDALGRWRAWRAAGATLVIVTASPEILVAPFARALGADRLIGTRLALDARGRVTGDLEGLNCRGAEKVARLRAVYGPGVRLRAAYGDSSGDTEMLAIAEEAGLRVFRQKP